jgi:hypothetical protein
MSTGCFQVRKIGAAHIVQAEARRDLGPGEIGFYELRSLIRLGFHSGRGDERLEDRLREIGVREIRAHDPSEIELGSRQLGSDEFRCHELGAAQVRIGQIGSR